MANNYYLTSETTYKFSKRSLCILIVLLVLCIFSYSCVNEECTKLENKLPDSVWVPRYAKGFRVEYYKNYKKVIVKDPWNKNKTLASYILKANETKLNFNLNYTVISIPLKTMACLFAPDIAFAQQLNLISLIKATSSINYIHNATLRNQVLDGKTVDVGPSENFNIEKLIASGVSACFVSPFRENRYHKLQEAGIAVIVNACHMEDDPLARAEWLLFFSLFFNMETKAKSIFLNIEQQYLNAKKLTDTITHRPTVFSGKLYQDVWYVSGGKSYISRIFQDAGAEYIWQDLPFSGSEPYDLEIIMSKALNADFWVIQEFTDKDYNYQRLASESTKYTYFDAYKNKKIVLCNSKLTPYYEDGVLQPHLILKDLIHIFHPEILPNHKAVYFKPLKK